MRLAACLGMFPKTPGAQDIFFPEGKLYIAGKALGPSSKERTRAARAVCAHCPVLRECHAYAEAFKIEYGVWGGRPHSTRERIRQRQEARQQL